VTVSLVVTVSQPPPPDGTDDSDQRSSDSSLPGEKQFAFSLGGSGALYMSDVGVAGNPRVSVEFRHGRSALVGCVWPQFGYMVAEETDSPVTSLRMRMTEPWRISYRAYDAREKLFWEFGFTQFESEATWDGATDERWTRSTLFAHLGAGIRNRFKDRTSPFYLQAELHLLLGDPEGVPVRDPPAEELELGSAHIQLSGGMGYTF
jgi:hypothetical protein